MTDTRSFPYDVFASYSREDTDRVEQVVDELRAGGLKVWFDRDEIRLGERIRRRVFAEGIPICALVLVFMSRRSLDSEFVKDEIDAARWRELDSRKVVIVIVLLDDVGPTALQEDLRGKLHFDLRGDFAEQWQSQKTRLIDEVTAIIRGEAHRGGEATLRVGDHLIRFFHNYRFRRTHENSSLDQLNDDQLGKVGLSVARAMLGGEPGEDEDLPDTTAGKAGGTYLDDTREFVQRYGEYSLQQMVLYFLEEGKLSLSGGFQLEELEELTGKVRIMVHLFAIHFAFEKIGAAHSHFILVHLRGASFAARLAGDFEGAETVASS